MHIPAGQTRCGLRRGVTAVEMIAVVTIIAILALILIPTLRGRVAHSRSVAVEEELANLAKVVSLAHEETEYYFRLQDYDNLAGLLANPDDPQFYTDPNIEVPVAVRTGLLDEPVMLTAAQRQILTERWQGPYTQFNNYMTIGEIRVAWPEIDNGINPPVPGDGPIFALAEEDGGRYPLDPWGAPYLFFGPGILQETTYFGTPVLYSMGPDSLPGDNAAPSSGDYYPSPVGVLGTEDDVVWNF